jgi:hypothetical protein
MNRKVIDISTEKVKIGAKNLSKSSDGVMTLRMTDLHVINPTLFRG